MRRKKKKKKKEKEKEKRKFRRREKERRYLRSLLHPVIWYGLLALQLQWYSYAQPTGSRGGALEGLRACLTGQAWHNAQARC